MNKDTFTQNVLDCKDTLYRMSMSILKNEKDCEDAVQEAVTNAYEKLDTLKSEEYFSTWLVRILINVCNKQLRYKKHNFVTDEIYEGTVDNPYVSTEIFMALEKLPTKIRTVMILYYVEEYSVKEIKSILKIPEGTVKSRLSKGRSLLRLEIDI